MECAEARSLISRRQDGTLAGGDARMLAEHLDGCAACRAFRREIAAEERALAELWPAVAAPSGFAERVAAALPSRAQVRPGRSHIAFGRVPAAAVLLLALLLGGLLVNPVRAGIESLLRNVVVRESEPPSLAWTVPLTAVSLEEAQARVSWRVRQPRELPAGYRLVAVTADEVHLFADGPTVVLYYARGENAVPSLRVVQLRATGRLEEPVAPDAARSVSVGGRNGILIDGEWIERDGRRLWERGRLLRLIVEDGEIVLQLEADPREGWNARRLIAAAESLR